jgi:hypothetical protein
MKTLKYLFESSLLVLSYCVFFQSCQSLDENPAGILVSESFFSTAEDLDAAVTGTYAELTSNRWGGFGHTNIWTPLFGADDLTSQVGKPDYVQFDCFAATSMNSSLKACAWTSSYRVIYAANNVLKNIDKVNAKESVKIQAMSEVRFLRAWAYFWLVRVFGEVPIQLDNEMNYSLPKSPIKDVYNQIISDLQYAEGNLPDGLPSSVGRPCKMSVKALLAQVYLAMAGYPLKETDKYAIAAQEAKAVIDSKQYYLLENYADLWKYSSDGNPEILWAIIFCPLGECGNGNLNTFQGLNTQPGEEGGWDQVFCEVGFYNRFPSGPRKDATFLTTFTDPNTGKKIPWQESTYRHPFLSKYRDGMVQNEPNYGGSTHMGGRDLNYLRFAEILLIYAEAQDMADGAPNSLSYECINKIRHRAGLNELVHGLNQIAFRDSVIAEKGWEFCGEYCRWFDLVRTEKVEEMNAYKAADDLKPQGTIDKSKYFAPIPYTEVLLDPALGN